MKKLSFIIFVFTMTFFNCDGRDRKHKTNAEILKENKLFDSFSEKVKYLPEAYSEISTDTILSNGYKIKIRTFSNMSQSILDEFVIENITHKLYFRKLRSEVYIEKNSRLVFNKVIDHAFFESNLDHNTFKLDDHVLNPIEVDQQKSMETNKVVLTAALNIPRKPDNTSLFNILIDDLGNVELKNINYAGT